jgi:hypothetical protein
MFNVLQILSVLFTAVATTTTVAHALELPGKLRLTRDEYLTVQRIYYPGFTISSGFGEGPAPIVTAILLLFTPAGSKVFWLRLLALFALVGVQGVYWLVTHQVNRYWMRDTLEADRGESREGFASRFFLTDPASRSALKVEPLPADWTPVRDRWEYSHLARAGLTLVSLIALVTAMAIQRPRRS